MTVTATRRTRSARPGWRLPGAVAIAAAVALAWRHRRRGGSTDWLRSTTRVSRNTEVVRLGARVGTTVAANRARRVFASAERKEALDADPQLRIASDVAATLGNMKGELMKLGQLA